MYLLQTFKSVIIDVVILRVVYLEECILSLEACAEAIPMNSLVNVCQKVQEFLFRIFYLL